VDLWLNFIENIIASITWPLGAVIIAFVLRKPLTGVLHRVKKVKGAGIELDLSNTLEEIDENITDDAAFITIPSFASSIVEIANISTSAAISHAWSLVEQAIRSKIKRLDPQANLYLVNNVIKQLKDENLIKPETAKALERMRLLRNDVFYKNREASFPQAVDYGRKAELLVNIINNIPENKKNE